MQTFLQLKTKLRSIIWPASEAKNLRVPHDAFFVQAMIDLQTNVDCLQDNNTSLFPACSLYWENAKTVVLDAPKGVFKRVFTIANDNWRDKVQYWSTNWTEIEGWANWLYAAITPTNAGLPKLQQGFYYAEKAVDSTIGRARVGSWAINRKKLYVAPWIQSNETLVVEWDGVKSEWLDTDGVDTTDWTPDVEDAIALYVRSRHELHFGDPKLSRLFAAEYASSLSDIMLYCRNMTRQQENLIPSRPRFVSQTEVDDDVAPTAATSFTVALLGDWGRDSADLAGVVSSMKALSPGRIFTLGDNVYDQGTAPFTTYFSDYITDDQLTNLFWPSWGNHDYDYGINLLTAFFTLKNNERYYTVVYGPVQYFILSTDPREMDGGYVNLVTSTETSIMGEWLKLQLAMSTAKWKVVIGHHSPYTSDVNNTPGNKWMRWPFKAWGADIYLGAHGHNFEDIIVDDFRYIVCGLGGHSIRAFGAATTGVQRQYNSDYAFLKLTATCDELDVTLIDKQGTEIYGVALT